MIRIEAIDRIRATDDNGQDVRMEPGDVKSVGDKFGRLACEFGWAKDTAGKIETGERRTGVVELTPAGLAGETSLT